MTAKLLEFPLQCAASLTCHPLPSLQALGLPEFLKQRNAELVVTADKDGPNCGALLTSVHLRGSAPDLMSCTCLPSPFVHMHSTHTPQLISGHLANIWFLRTPQVASPLPATHARTCLLFQSWPVPALQAG